MRKSTSGFTIVELLVVIAVIGILTTIGILSFTRYQSSSRDTQRSSRTTLIAEALEKYYDKNGEYPSCSALTQSAAIVDTAVLPGIDPLALLTPKSASSDTNSIKCTDLTGAASDPDVFAYVGDGSAACNTGTGTGASCLSWTLKYIDESSGTVKTLQSRRNTAIATSGTPVLSGSGISFTQINLSWMTIDNAISYQLQRADNAGFTTNVVNTTVSGASYSLTGIPYTTTGTTYYFRVLANAAVGQPGVWSNTLSATTWGLSTPNTSVALNPTYPSTMFTTSWPAVLHATSYNVQCSTTGTTWSGCTGSTATLSFSWGPTSQGTPLYFRTQAVNGSYLSSWSNTATATTTIDAPAAFPLYSSNNLAQGWNYLNVASGATCPAGTSLSSDWYANGAFWTRSGTSQSYGLGWNTSVTISVATKCVTAYTNSAWTWASNTASMGLPWPTVTTWIPGDRTMHWSGTCPNWSTSDNFYWRTQGAVNASGNTWASEPQGTYYSNQGMAWGNGNAHVTLSCVGPWGTASVESTGMYGPGCMPTVTVAACTQ